MKKFKLGDRVIQINRDYYTSKRGWTGVVCGIIDDYETRVRFDRCTECRLDVRTVDLKLVGGQNVFISLQPKNSPDTEV